MEAVHDPYIDVCGREEGIYPEGTFDGYSEDNVPIPESDGVVIGHQPNEFDEIDERQFKRVLRKLDIQRVDSEIRTTVVRTIEALNAMSLSERRGCIFPINKDFINRLVLDIYTKHYMK